MNTEKRLTSIKKGAKRIDNERFISLEGIDGSGKSTQIQQIKHFLESHGEKVAITREPSENTQIGRSLRNFLTKKDFDKMLPETQLLLFFAARAEHVAKFIKPMLKQGFWVISDRFVHSSYAYQGAFSGCRGSHLDKFDIDYLARWICQSCFPALIILFDLKAEDAQQRIRTHQYSKKSAKGAAFAEREKHCFDVKHIDFQKRVRAEYLALAEKNETRWKIVNAGQGREKVTKEIHLVLTAYLQGKENN